MGLPLTAGFEPQGPHFSSSRLGARVWLVACQTARSLSALSKLFTAHLPKFKLADCSCGSLMSPMSVVTGRSERPSPSGGPWSRGRTPLRVGCH
jgi:hypothetical protein